MKISKIFVFLLLLFSVLIAQSTQTRNKSVEGDFNDLIDTVVQNISAAGDQFVKTGQFATTGATTAVQEMFNVFSGGNCDPTPTATTSYYSNIVLTLITVAFCITIIYLTGHIIQRADMIAVAKNEYYQLSMTTIRVIILFGIIFAGDIFIRIQTADIPSTDIVYYGRTTLIDAAMAFSRLITNEISKNYSALVIFNMILYTIQTATLYVGTNFRSMYTFNLGVALKPFIDIIAMGMQTITLALGEWLTHTILLCFLKKWGWTIFIPISILISSFPPTRQIGIALYALIVALLLFYPFMFIVTYEIHKLLSPYLSDSLTEVKNMATKTGIFGVGAMFLAVAMLGGGAVLPIIGGVIVIGAYDLMKNIVYYIVIMSILMPFFTIFVTLTAAKEIAKVAGVDINYMSFLKII